MQALHQKEPMGPLALRLGLAFSLLWSVLTKMTKTEMVAGLFKGLGFGPLANETVVIVVAIGLLALSVLLILGKYLHIVGILLTFFFLMTLIAGALAGDAAFSVGPGLWKDFALLGVALYFVFTGDGKDCCIKQ
jgi:uncharacterized membrane protein YphA (DoxX/SURF4 family)